MYIPVKVITYACCPISDNVCRVSGTWASGKTSDMIWVITTYALLRTETLGIEVRTFSMCPPNPLLFLVCSTE